MGIIGQEYTTASIKPKFQIPVTPEVTVVSTGQTARARTLISTNGGGNVWTLPLPTSGLDFGATFNWDAESRGVVGDIVDFFKNNVSAEGDTTMDKLQSILDSIQNTSIEEIKKVGSAILNKAAYNVANEMVGTGTVNAILQKTGLSYNSNKVLYFQEPTFKTYSFTFDLVPQNEKESATIKKGLQALKSFAAPSVAGEIFFTYPSLFDVTITLAGENSVGPILFRSTQLALTDWKLNMRGDDGLRWHSDGMPTRMSLTVGFKETKITTKSQEEATQLLG